MIGQMARDFAALRRVVEPTRAGGAAPLKTILQDGFTVLAVLRARESARRLRVPAVNRVLRLAQMALYGVEIGNEVQLGDGVWFVHSLGTVVGGRARIGARVRFMGNNTVGSAHDDGAPVIEDDVVIGCGARILGPIRVGARSVIGANAVVLTDVPPDSLAVGAPAVARPLGRARPFPVAVGGAR